MLWFLIVSVVMLVIAMILPVTLSPFMQLYFKAKVESIGQSNGASIHLLPGSEEETYKSTIAAEYNADFTPNRLENDKNTFTSLEILFGPALVTGSPLNLVGTSTENRPDFSSNASIHFQKFWMPIVFYLILIALIVLLGLILKKQSEVFKFIVVLTIIWALWALIAWLVSGISLGRVSDMLNQLLTDEQGNARYTLDFLSVILAPVRIFIVGIVVMTLASMFRKVKTDNTKNGYTPVKG